MTTYFKHVPSGDIYPAHPLFDPKEYVPCDIHGREPAPTAPPEPEPLVAPEPFNIDALVAGVPTYEQEPLVVTDFPDIDIDAITKPAKRK